MTSIQANSRLEDALWLPCTCNFSYLTIAPMETKRTNGHLCMNKCSYMFQKFVLDPNKYTNSWLSFFFFLSLPLSLWFFFFLVLHCISPSVIVFHSSYYLCLQLNFSTIPHKFWWVYILSLTRVSFCSSGSQSRRNTYWLFRMPSSVAWFRGTPNPIWQPGRSSAIISKSRSSSSST